MDLALLTKLYAAWCHQIRPIAKSYPAFKIKLSLSANHMKHALCIQELGLVPGTSKVLAKAGFATTQVNTVRKGLQSMKKQAYDLVLCEFRYSPKYGVFISNMDSLISCIAGKYPDTRLLTLVLKQDMRHLEKLIVKYPERKDFISLAAENGEHALLNLLANMQET